MLSRTLVQMIEDHCEQITGRIIRRHRQDPEFAQMKKLPESELRDRAGEVLKNLGHWLSAGREAELSSRYEQLGRRRFEESIPLYEVVRSLQILKENMIEYVREQGIGQNPVELYAEEELEHGVGLFFDRAVYHTVHGYETALRQKAHLAA
jgi:hypothetical protein